MEPVLMIQKENGRRYLLHTEREPSRDLSVEEKKVWLSQYRLLDQQIDRLIREEKDWRERALYTGHEDGTCSTADAAGKIAALCTQINRQIDRLADLRQDIEGLFEQVPDQTLRLLLTYKYIDGLSFEEIADKLHYCWRQIARKHADALRALPLRLLEGA